MHLYSYQPLANHHHQLPNILVHVTIHCPILFDNITILLVMCILSNHHMINIIHLIRIYMQIGANSINFKTITISSRKSYKLRYTMFAQKQCINCIFNWLFNSRKRISMKHVDDRRWFVFFFFYFLLGVYTLSSDTLAISSTHNCRTVMLICYFWGIVLIN